MCVFIFFVSVMISCPFNYVFIFSFSIYLLFVAACICICVLSRKKCYLASAGRAERFLQTLADSCWLFLTPKPLQDTVCPAHLSAQSLFSLLRLDFSICYRFLFLSSITYLKSDLSKTPKNSKAQPLGTRSSMWESLLKPVCLTF